jgi:hypothetical protein
MEEKTLIEKTIGLFLEKFKKNAIGSVFLKDGVEMFTNYQITSFELDKICMEVKKELQNES